MQGRITKVLNMKPIEVLGMIEESAGTKMFETKKEQALKNYWEKKELKLKEIDCLLKEEITPTLEKLEKQRETFSKWTDINTECEKLTRFSIAFQYFEKENFLLENENSLKLMEEEIVKSYDLLNQFTNDLELIDGQISKFKQNKSENSKIKNIEKKITELSNLIVKYLNFKSLSSCEISINLPAEFDCIQKFLIENFECRIPRKINCEETSVSNRQRNIGMFRR